MPPIDEPTSGGEPGPQGPAGSPGAPGAPGINSYTTTTAAFTQPAPASAPVQIAVAVAVWMIAGQTIYIAGGGYYAVTSVDDATHVTIVNTGASGNAAPGATIAGGAGVGPAGVAGSGGGGGGGTSIGPYSTRPAPGNAGAIFVPTDGPISFIDDGTEWRPMIPGGRIGKQPPPIANWTLYQPANNATFIEQAGTLFLSAPSAGNSQAYNGIAYVPKGSATVITACLTVSGAAFGGLSLRSSVTNCTPTMYGENITYPNTISFFQYPSGINAGLGTYFMSHQSSTHNNLVWYRFAKDNSNTQVWSSNDGIDFRKEWQGPTANFGANEPDQVGFSVIPSSGLTPTAVRLLSWEMA